MAPSSSSSHNNQTPWHPTLGAFWVRQKPEMDHSKAFETTEVHFKARLKALRVSGVFVVSQEFELFSGVEAYIQEKFPDGIDLLGFRMHTDETSLPLSRQPGGFYTLRDAGTDTATAVQSIFSKVRKFVMIEGCKTGFGKNGILKHVVSLCQPGVVGIGSKGSKFEVGFDPLLPGYMRFECLQSKQDVTRIYYKTENGTSQNIPVEELMLLWDLFKEKCTTLEGKQQGFELCYKLLGERNDPVAFSRIRSENKALIDSVLGDFESIRQQLLQVKVAKSGAKSIWVAMLGELEALRCELGGENDSPEIPIDEKARGKTADQIVTHRGGLFVPSWTAYQKVYRFLLGCAFIDKFKPLLMLLDEETSYGPASQAIRALSALTAHGDDNLSITTILGHYFPIMKKSYLAAKNSYHLKQWFQGISEGVCFNNMIKFIDEFHEERIRPSKEELLRVAILVGNVGEVKRLIEQGVDLSTIKIGDQSNLFFEFLLLKHSELSDESSCKATFMNKNYPDISTEDLDNQLSFISKYLAGTGNITEGVYYANLIGDVKVRGYALQACAGSAASLTNIPQAIEILQLCCDEQLLSINERNTLALEIYKMAKTFREFDGALRAARMIQEENLQFFTTKDIFNFMTEQKSLNEVIDLFEKYNTNFCLISYLLEDGISRLLNVGDFNRALQIVDSIPEKYNREIPLPAYGNPDVESMRNKNNYLISIVRLYLNEPDKARDDVRLITNDNVENKEKVLLQIAETQIAERYNGVRNYDLVFNIVNEMETPLYVELVLRQTLYVMLEENRLSEGITRVLRMGSKSKNALFLLALDFRRLKMFKNLLLLGEMTENEDLIAEAKAGIAQQNIEN